MPGRTTTGGVTTALIYTRVSSDEQAREGVSLDAQLAECRRYAAQRGWALGEEYQDVLSGKRDDRPAYQRLLADVRRLRGEGKALVVVVAALDRLGRRILERVRSREELQALGVQTHSVRDGGEVSDLVANMLAAVAEEEVRRMGERIKASNEHVRGSGWRRVGRCAWGYRWRPATPEERATGAPQAVLEIDPLTAPYVRELFARVAAGESTRSAARWIASLPASVRGDRNLNQSGVRKALSATVYTPGPADRWPGLIDPATWRAVQARIAEHQHTPRQASGKYLLTGLIRCPRCGGRMSGDPATGRRGTRYVCRSELLGAAMEGRRCGGSVMATAFESAVLEEVSEIVGPITDDEALLPDLRRAWAMLGRSDEAEDRARRIAALEGERTRARDRLAVAAIRLVDGILDRAGYEAAKGRIEADLAAVDVELERLRGTAAAPVLPPLEEVLAAAGDCGRVLRESDTAAQREVLALLIDQITPERLGWGRYAPRIAWTPLGEAMRGLAAVTEEGTDA